MKKRVIVSFITFLLLIISCSLLSVYADSPDWDNATIITEEDLSNGIPFDKPYKMTPTKKVYIDYLGSNGVVLVREDNGYWTKVTASTVYIYNHGGDEETQKIFTLIAGKDYYFEEGSSTSDAVIRKTAVDVIELVLDANGGIFRNGDTDKEQILFAKGHVTNIGTDPIKDFRQYKPTREGFKFYDYNTKPDGSGFSIDKYSSFTKDITFYATWKKLYTVELYANGGEFVSRKVNPDINDYDRTDHLTCLALETLPGSNEWTDYYSDDSYYKLSPEREGFKVRGWNTKPDGSGVYLGEKPFSSDKALYAIWECKSDHKYGAWKTTKKATETATGKKVRTCSKCGKTETKTIAQLKPTLPAVKISKAVAGKKYATIKWTKVSAKNQKKIAKIQIQYSTDKSFKKNVKTVYAKKSATSKKITKLTSKKSYYFRIRAYKSSSGKVHVSKWSSTKYAKVK